MSKSIHTKGAGAQRLSRIPPYLFAEIDRKVQEKKRSGVDVISLGIGDPDLPTPARIVNVLQEAAADPHNHRYPSCWHQFMRECRIADCIDTVTVVYRYLFWHVSDSAANLWRDAVRQIMAEENLAYEIDDVGGDHSFGG